MLEYREKSFGFIPQLDDIVIDQIMYYFALFPQMRDTELKHIFMHTFCENF